MPRRRINGEGSIYPHRNGYAAYVWVNCPDGTRMRRYVYGKTREKTHAKWAQLRAQAAAGPMASAAPRLEAYLTYWLNEIIRPHRAPKTYEQYEMVVRLYILPFLGSKRLDRIRSSDVQTWINTVRETCRCCYLGKDNGRGKCCSAGVCCTDTPPPRTVKTVRDTLRASLSHAVNEGRIVANPVLKVTIPSVRRRRVHPWTNDEARRFLESAKAGGDPLYAAYVLTLALGLRRGELLGLKWENIDFDRKMLYVERQVQRANGKLWERETKTPESESFLPLPEFCLVALRAHQAQQLQALTSVGVRCDSSTYVFSSGVGTPMEPRNFNRAFHRRRSVAGIRHIRLHDARHTCATLLAELGIHPSVAMRILRHADVQTTMQVYTWASPEATQAALEKLSETLG